MFRVANIQSEREGSSQGDEVKMQYWDSEPDTPTFGFIEIIALDRFDDAQIFPMVDCKQSNIETVKKDEEADEEQVEDTSISPNFSFKEENTENKDEDNDGHQDGPEKEVEQQKQSAEAEENTNILKCEAVVEATEQLEKVDKPQSSSDSQSSLASTTLSISKCGTRFDNIQQNHGNQSFFHTGNASKELNMTNFWKQQMFGAERTKRRRVKPLQFWAGETIRLNKSQHVIIRERKKVQQVFIHEQDCRLIYDSYTYILTGIYTKGQITIPPHVSVRLNFVNRVVIQVGKELSLFICGSRLLIMAQKGKNRLVVNNCRLSQLENLLDVPCTLQLKIN